VVGDEKDLYKKNLIATHLNWINRPDFKSKNLGARIRHGHPIEKCTIKKLTNEEIEVIFQKAQRAVTPGQSIVFYGQVLAKPQMASENDELYAGQEVLGGGIIK
jgi:tRNA-specific 2-thiouridylase